MIHLGESFRVGSIDPRFIGDMWVEFFGEAVLPPLGGPTAEVTVPFLFEGFFRPPAGSPPNPVSRTNMGGGGLATLFLRTPSPVSAPGWQFQRLEYLFIEDPSVVPEPASMLLVGSGIAILFERRRRRRSVS